MGRIKPGDRLIVALDVASPAEAKRWVRRLSPAVGHFKVGLELFTAWGPEAVKLPLGARVFLDLKFFDIPNTMVGAVRSAAALKPALVNIHALAGPTAVRQCAAALKKLKNPPKLLAVTILTSFTDEELKRTGMRNGAGKMVSDLCRMALAAGADGVVASPLEVKKLREEFGEKFIIVTPGVRPSWSEKNDQKRTATPYRAVKDGADYVVVGRPILNAPDPLEAARTVIREIEEACE
ncbi:MAG: orotidine-5'-phosphate decarboxylase [Nitrospinae bacterium]|nr:orotidine-5'-phosphate decarboxylase [Nitrospinota bacterium]